MRHLIHVQHLIVALAALPLVADAGPEIQMPSEPARPAFVKRRHATSRPRPKLAPAKEVATDDDDSPPGLAPAKDAADKPNRDGASRQQGASNHDGASDHDGASKALSAPGSFEHDGAEATDIEKVEPTAGDESNLDATSLTDSVATPSKKSKWIEPYGAIAGGMRLESLHQPDTAHTGTQNPTVAVSRLGLRGGVGSHITFASEFEASLGGPLGYGASVWEGQAAIAVRNQFVRYARDGFTFAAGRIDDPASFDYVSQHVADLLLTDQYTRDPLLYSGADRGNGLWGSYDIGRHVTAGLTFHSTNPTGITGTLIIGGKLQPFDRPFYLAAAQVGNNQNNLPDQNLHIYFGSPSLTLHYDHFEAKTEVQMYSLDTQEAIMTDQTIRGYNLRVGARGWTQTPIGRLTGFANVSRNKNEILDPTTSKYRLPDLFKSYTLSGGVDFDYTKHNGIGLQYALVDTIEPDHHTRQHYLNVGTTYWIEDSLAIGVRAAVFAQQISGEMMTTGSRSLFVTARLVLQ